MHKDLVAGWAGVLFVLALVGVGIWMEYAIWGECRDAGHSILYCMRVLAR